MRTIQVTVTDDAAGRIADELQAVDLHAEACCVRVLMRDRRALAAAARAYLAGTNTLAFRPTKEVETATVQAHHDLTEALNALD